MVTGDDDDDDFLIGPSAYKLRAKIVCPPPQPSAAVQLSAHNGVLVLGQLITVDLYLIHQRLRNQCQKSEEEGRDFPLNVFAPPHHHYCIIRVHDERICCCRQSMMYKYDCLLLIAPTNRRRKINPVKKLKVIFSAFCFVLLKSLSFDIIMMDCPSKRRRQRDVAVVLLAA